MPLFTVCLSSLDSFSASMWHVVPCHIAGKSPLEIMEIACVDLEMSKIWLASVGLQPSGYFPHNVSAIV
jgi:hypothetical protein